MSDERASKKQQELLSFIDGFIKGNGYGPSYREIMRSLGYKSVSTVAVHIDGLITRGYLRKRDNSARSIEVIGRTFEEARTHKDQVVVYEQWLTDIIVGRLERLANHHSSQDIDDLNVLIETVRILGFDDAYRSLHNRQQVILKDL